MKKKATMEIIHPHAAGIDVGSRSHFVAIGQDKEDIQQFGVYNEDLIALTQWLLDNDITHVAMESTGTYWQSLFSTLQEAGIIVTLCNGKFYKKYKRKKDRCNRLSVDTKTAYTWARLITTTTMTSADFSFA
jgi:transposase